MTTLKIATYKPASADAARVMVYDAEQMDEYDVLQKLVDAAHDGEYPSVQWYDRAGGAVYDTSSPYYGERVGKFLGYYAVADLVVGAVVIAS